MYKFTTMLIRYLLFSFILTFVGGNLQTSSAQNSQAVNTFTKSNNLKYAGIGIKVVEVESNRIVCSHNEHLALCPASTLKVLTTATALELFGSDYQYTTKILYEGTIDSQGLLTGNIVVAGSGDPSLGSSYLHDTKESFLANWLSAIQKTGIKSISGDIIVVDDLFGYEGISNRWIWEDLGNYYASATYGISIFDNTYHLYLKSGMAGSSPTILYSDPEIPGLALENNLKAANNSSDSAYIYGIPFSFNRRIYGTIPANKNIFSIKGDIPDPGLLLAQTLYDYLENNNIKITGRPVTNRIKPMKQDVRLHEIYQHRGNSLEEIIKIVNFRSNNHFAEHLFYKIGWEKSEACPSYVPTLAAKRITKFWQQKGIETKGLFQYDGNGLSNANAISAATLTNILIYMQKHSKYADTFYHSLPLAGKEGTVRSFLKGTSLEGKARIKSGSISNVHAYTGFFEKEGKKYAFSLLVNNFTGSRTVLRKQMETLLLSF